MLPILHRSSWRHLLQHPWQAGLSVLGLALAVAVVAGIDLTNSSARRAFDLSVESVAGRASHEINGGPNGLPDRLYLELRVETGLRSMSPVLEAWVSLPDPPRRSLRLLGIDPFAEPPFRSYTSGLSRGDGDLSAFLLEPGAVAMGEGLARELGLELGGRFLVATGGRQVSLVLVSLLTPNDELGRQALSDLLVADLATAQEVLGRLGRLDRIDLVAPPGEAGELMLRQVRSRLPEGVRLEEKAARRGALDQMTRAFRLNLTALSLLALLVGLFLIYNTMTFAVVSHRPLLGRLRALGVTRQEIFRLVLGEALVLGLAGTALGLLLGSFLAHGLLAMAVRTINDLYFKLSVSDVVLTPFSFTKSALLGFGATAVAAFLPAREAAGAPPRAAMIRSPLEQGHRRAAPRLALAGAAMTALAGLLLLVPGRSLLISFTAVFLTVMGAALAVPFAMAHGSRWLTPWLRRPFGLLGAMAARRVEASLSRTGVAVAALVVAVSVTIGVGVMVESFRRTLIDWLEVTLQADIYISPRGTRGPDPYAVMSPAARRHLLASPGLDFASTYRRVEVRTDIGPLPLVALEMRPAAFAAFQFGSGNADTIYRQWHSASAVIVSEPLAYHRELAKGDELMLETDRGPRPFSVVGVFRDYGSDRGVAMISRPAYDRFWDDPKIQSLGLFAREDPQELLTEVERRAAQIGQQLSVTSNHALKRASLEIFDRTFAITGVLRLLAVGVAFVGVLAALMALRLEQSRELGLLRASGLTPAQVWGLITAENGLMGLLAGLLAIPLGLTMALLLIHVINRRSFGWTMELAFGPQVLWQAVLLALTAALLAGLYPAWKMAQTSPARALREE